MKITVLGYEISVQKILPIVEVPIPQVKKPKAPRIQKCIVLNKRMFTREQASEEAKLTKAPNIRFYCCEFCGTWHLTSKKKFNTL